MAGRDFHNTVLYKAVAADNVAQTGTATGTYIDRQGFGAVEFVLTRGTSSASTIHKMTVLSATASSGGATVTAASWLLGADTPTASGTTEGTIKVGYIGPNRWVTVKYFSTVATGAYAITAVMGSPIKQPQSTASG